MSPPNVVWITLESVRSDHTTVGGYERDTTPNLLRLANRSDAVSFDNCFAHSIWTPACSASILSGAYMSRHGVGKEGTAERQLPTSLPTLPELLSEAGYRTGCFSANAFLSEATGLGRGFDDFYWLSKAELYKNVSFRPLFSYLRHLRSQGPGFTLDHRKHNTSWILTEVLTDWLKTGDQADEPKFAYAHIGNPHHPYAPPKKWRGEYTDEIEFSAQQALEFSLSVYEGADSIKERMANGQMFSETEVEAVQAMYDAEIRYADECIGKILDTVDSLKGDTIVVVTADHGELFGELNLLGHNLTIHDAITHIPMVIAGIDSLDPDSSELVQHADVTRTLGELVNVPVEHMDGVDLRTDSRDVAILQRGRAIFEKYLEHNPEFDMSRFHQSYLNGVRSKRFKLATSEDRTDLFELPDESTDVSNAHQREVERLQAVADALPDWHAGESDRSDFTEEMEEQLKHLGYL